MGFNDEMTFRDCPWCGVRDAQMRIVLGPAQQVNRADQIQRWWTSMTCPRCAGIISIETNSPNQGPPKELSVVPAGDSGVDIAHLPPDVERFYRDAIRVLDAGVPEAAAVQLRRTLEAATRHAGQAQGNLVDRISKLIDSGAITKEFGQALHHVRKVGNLGAHDTDEIVDEEEARRALRFTTQILRNLFEIPAELAAIQGPDQ
jgi:hypothetical protein